MPISVSVRPLVVIPKPQGISDRGFLPSSHSTTSDSIQPSVYKDSLLSDLKHALEVLPYLSDDIIVPSSCPPSPTSESRIQHITKQLGDAVESRPLALPSMLGLGCVRYCVTASSLMAGSSAPTVLPLPDTEEQWERWESGKEEAPPPMTHSEGQTFLRKSFCLPSRTVSRSASIQSNPVLPVTQTKKRKRTPSLEVRLAANLPFRAVKKLTSHKKAAEPTVSAKSIPRSPRPRPGSSQQHPIDVVAPRLSATSSPPHDIPVETTFRATRPCTVLPLTSENDAGPSSTTFTAASQEFPLHIDPSPLHPHPTVDSSFDIDLSMTFDPMHTSTPTKQTTNTHLSTPPVTPNNHSSGRLRTKAAAYRSQEFTPAALAATPRLDPASLRRVPTFDELRQASATKRKDKTETKRRKKFASLAASQSSQLSMQLSQDDLSTLIKITHIKLEEPIPEESLSVSAPITTPQKSASPPAQVHTLTSSGGQDAPTASAIKRAKFGSFMSGSTGTFAFSSQFDLEGQVDDISRFMQDDVDDVFD